MCRETAAGAGMSIDQCSAATFNLCIRRMVVDGFKVFTGNAETADARIAFHLQGNVDHLRPRADVKPPSDFGSRRFQGEKFFDQGWQRDCASPFCNRLNVCRRSAGQALSVGGRAACVIILTGVRAVRAVAVSLAARLMVAGSVGESATATACSSKKGPAEADTMPTVRVAYSAPRAQVAMAPRRPRSLAERGAVERKGDCIFVLDISVASSYNKAPLR